MGLINTKALQIENKNWLKRDSGNLTIDGTQEDEKNDKSSTEKLKQLIL